MLLIKLIGLFLSSYVEKALAARAEYGAQEVLPGFKTNSSYTALGATRYIFVCATAAYQANQAVNATSTHILGVMQNNPDVGEAMVIAISGSSKVVAGEAITANKIITTNASGRAAAVTSGDLACGRLLEASGADGDVVSAVLFHPIRWSGAA